MSRPEKELSIKELAMKLKELQVKLAKHDDDIVDLKIAVSKLTKAQEFKASGGTSLHKVEEFNGEAIPALEDSNLKMNTQDQIMSMKNAIKILPPNLKIEGKHSKGNIEAICGFKVTDELYNSAYEGFVDEAV